MNSAKEINLLFKWPSSMLLAKRIGDVMVTKLASSEVDHGFEPWSGQTKYYKIGMCCFSAKYVEYRRKSKDWLTQKKDNEVMVW